MIQFNLLPDVKLEFIRTRRRKRLVVLVSACVAGGSVGLLVLLVMVVKVWQHQSIKALEKDIATNNTQLQNIPDISKVLTVQTQLNTLTQLHDSKPLASRMFVYLSQLTPATASITRVQLSFEKSTMTVSGTADSLQTVNTYVDTLKFTDFTTLTQTDPQRAFSEVVLASFARNDSGVTYEVNFKFDNKIYEATQDNVVLVVPKLVTTRSELSRPGLFDSGQGATQ